MSLGWSGQAQGQFERPTQEPAPGADPAAVRVEPPRLVHFEEAPYPPLAQESGLEGDVVLKLTVAADGTVADAEVVQEAGHGFDEAARQAALKFRFDPAMRDGQPTSARILYRYSFTLAAAPPPSELAPPPAPVGNLEGRLWIAGTDQPLAGATVILTLPDGQSQTIVSDANGRFELVGVRPGSYRVLVQNPGFETVQQEESVVAGEATEVTYRILPQAEELEVTVRGERPPREVTRRTIERREIERIPGTSGDALRSLESLPGVARPPGLAGILIVRGSYPDDTQVYVDGSEVPFIYHFGGLRSAIPTELLERIDFYPGNYGTRFGRGMGGIVDVGLSKPDTRCRGPYGAATDRDGCYHGLAQVDLIEGRVLVQGPLPIPGWTFAVGARRSWVDAWIGPVLESAGANVTSLPVYYDVQAIAETEPTPASRLSLRFLGSDDGFAAVIDPMAQEPAFGGDLRFSQGFYQGQVLYENQLSAQVNSNTLLSFGQNFLGVSIGPLQFDLRTYPIQLRQEFGWSLSSGIKLNTGLDYVALPYDVKVRSPSPPGPGEPDSGPFSSQPILEAEERDNGFRQGWYADLEWQPHPRLRVVPGMRIDYAGDTEGVDISPRLNARYDLVQGQPGDRAHFRRRTTLKGGAGRYYQPPQFVQTNAVYGTPGLRSNRSTHYSLGVEQELTRQIDVSLEGFYKDLDRLVARGFAPNGSAYTNDGSGRVVGLETLLRYRPDARFFGWLAYTLSRSERRDSPQREFYLIQYDQTHNLVALGSYRLGRGWELGARFQLVSGSLTTSVRRPPSLPALYAADSGSYVPLQDEPNGERLPFSHQLDMRLDKRWQFESWQLGAYLDVYNVYANPRVESYAYDYNYSQRVRQTGVPFLPSVGIRGEF